MSKRRHGAGGAFDALVRAFAGLGADAGWARLPRATAPGSLGRTLGQGVLEGRLPKDAHGACAADASPLPLQALHNEAQRSIAELGAILWHALGGAEDAPELTPWLERPHSDPTVALSLSRRLLAEYATPEIIDRTCAFPGRRIWLLEIERAHGEIPGAIAVWRSRGADGEWRTRCACIWTRGPVGSPSYPLVMGARWDADGGHAVAGVCVIGPSWDEAARVAKGAVLEAVLARRTDAIGKALIARIVVPAALAWLDRHAGTARPAGRFGGVCAQTPKGRARAERPPRTVHPVPGAARTPPPAWITAEAQRAVEAIVLATAREGWRIGASSPVRAWRSGWAGYAEMGAIAWHAIRDLQAPIDSDAWGAMEKALRDGGLAAQSAHPAVETTSALVRKMLEQTGRSHVARAQDARTLCALEIPARLWRALGEAGPRPHPPDPLDLSDRWWLVEVEHPRDEEPNAIALWEEDGAEVVLAAFLCDDDGGGVSFPTVVTWRTTSEGERSEVGVAVLKGLIKANDPESPESRVGTIQIIDVLAAPDSGAIARAKTAIAMHLENDGRATPLASYRASTGTTSTQRQEVSTGRRSITALFAIERAPEPEPAEEHATGEGHRPGGRGRLRERHHVRAHWKRQAYGPKRSKRRWKVIEGYTRGPEPAEDQIAMTRLAEGQLQACDDDPRTCEGRRAYRRESMGSGKGPWQQEPKA